MLHEAFILVAENVSSKRTSFANYGKHDKTLVGNNDSATVISSLFRALVQRPVYSYESS